MGASWVKSGEEDGRGRGWSDGVCWTGLEGACFLGAGSAPFAPEVVLGPRPAGFPFLPGALWASLASFPRH